MARRLWRLRRGQEAGWPLFAMSRGLSRPLHESNVRCRVLNPARAEVGLEWVGFHVRRHTCASLLFEEGRNIAQVAAWLGHADPAFTLRTYVHLMDGGSARRTSSTLPSRPLTKKWE
jgi:integrase